MIARSWDGCTTAAQADEYTEYIQRTGVADLAATEGNRGVWLLRRSEGDRVRFRVVSLWDSMDAVRRFAGDDAQKARYYPDDARISSPSSPMSSTSTWSRPAGAEELRERPPPSPGRCGPSRTATPGTDPPSTSCWRG